MILRTRPAAWLLAFLLLLVARDAWAQSGPAPGDATRSWSVEAEHGPTKTVELDLTEGTWMDLDVSPDGKAIVFDLLGDIWSVPIAGGEATPVVTGPAFTVQPRFSPDGKHIAFTSDAGGGDNLWIAAADGSDARQITKETFRLLNNPAWTPDGKFLIARKHFTAERSLGAGELWMYSIDGGEGVRLTEKRDDQHDAGEPEVSPDGRFVYYSEDVSPGDRFEYRPRPERVDLRDPTPRSRHRREDDAAAR